MLLKYGADVNIQSLRGGYTALHGLLFSNVFWRKHISRMIKALLSAGADATLVDMEGKTALDVIFIDQEECCLWRSPVKVIKKVIRQLIVATDCPHNKVIELAQNLNREGSTSPKGQKLYAYLLKKYAQPRAR